MSTGALGAASTAPGVVTIAIKSALSAAPLCVVTLASTSTVAAIKAQIERVDGTAAHMQRLVYRGRHLDDEEGLEGISSQFDKTSGDGSAAPLVEIGLLRVDRTWAANLTDIENGWMDLREADESTKRNREIVTAAVRCDGVALQHASEELQADRGVVFAAVKSNGSALRFASDALRRDRDVVLTAVRGSALALRYAAEELWHDQEFTLGAVRAHGSALVYAPEHLRRDREVVFAAVQSDPSALRHAHPPLHHDPEIKRCVLAHAEGWNDPSGVDNSNASRPRMGPARLRCGIPDNHLQRSRHGSRVDAEPRL
mmetsp:Transcript_81858/g.228058  ORF Transcript_81858/g.228058 Transcript_81858/m.228058 type:complete len:313 (-) Transcript_81858:163-1101(-)